MSPVTPLVGLHEQKALDSVQALRQAIQTHLPIIEASLFTIHAAGLYEAYGTWSDFMLRMHRQLGRALGNEVGLVIATLLDRKASGFVKQQELPKLPPTQDQALNGLSMNEKLRIYRMAAVAGDTSAAAILKLREEMLRAEKDQH